MLDLCHSAEKNCVFSHRWKEKREGAFASLNGETSPSISPNFPPRHRFIALEFHSFVGNSANREERDSNRARVLYAFAFARKSKPPVGNANGDRSVSGANCETVFISMLASILDGGGEGKGRKGKGKGRSGLQYEAHVSLVPRIKSDRSR